MVESTRDIQVEISLDLTGVHISPTLYTHLMQIGEPNSHLCGIHFRLCVGSTDREKGESTSLKNKRLPNSENQNQMPHPAFRGLTSHLHHSPSITLPTLTLKSRLALYETFAIKLPRMCWGGGASRERKMMKKRQWGSHVRNFAFQTYHKSVPWWCFQSLKDKSWFF